jgi:TPR repeat protein
MEELHNRQICNYCGHLNTISFKKATFNCNVCRNINEIVIKQKKLSVYSNKMVQAELGNHKAQLEVAEDFYFNSNFDLALEWALKVVPFFPSEANFLIARIYTYGLNKKPRSLDSAIEYFKKSNLNDKQVLLNYINALYERKDLGDIKLILELSKNPLLSDTMLANFYIGLIYFYGFQTKKNYKKAAFYLEKAFKLGDKSVSSLLGAIYVDKNYKIVDYKKGLFYNKVAAELNVAGSISNLGYMYAKGLGVKKDHYTAFEYYKRAKQLGSPYGSYNYAENLYKGLGTEANKKEALKILSKLAKSKFKPAEKFLKKINKDSNNSKQLSR